MSEIALHAVTGAYGYSGKYIAARLLDSGQHVMTLTNSPHRENPFGDRLRAAPFHFDDPDKLAVSCEENAASCDAKRSIAQLG